MWVMASLARLERSLVVVASSALLLAACGGQAGGPAATASPSPSPSPTPTATPAAAPVILAQNVGTMGTILVAASNSHTVYTFDSDSPGVSRCSGGGAANPPPPPAAAGGGAPRRPGGFREVGPLTPPGGAPLGTLNS